MTQNPNIHSPSLPYPVPSSSLCAFPNPYPHPLNLSTPSRHLNHPTPQPISSIPTPSAPKNPDPSPPQTRGECKEEVPDHDDGHDGDDIKMPMPLAERLGSGVFSFESLPTTSFHEEGSVIGFGNGMEVLEGGRGKRACPVLEVNHLLGLGNASRFEPLPISAISGTGTGELLDLVCSGLQKFEESNNLDEEEDYVPAISIDGRPNVGKSSILNALVGEDRTIVSPISGTTRDAIDTEFTGPDGQVLLCTVRMKI